MSTTTDYRAIRRWGKETGSSHWYISEQVAKARRDNAPADAIYKADHFGGSGEWHTVSGLVDDHPFRLWYEATS